MMDSEKDARARSAPDGEGSFLTDVNRRVTPIERSGKWDIEAPTYVRAPDLPFPVLHSIRDDYSPRPAGPSTKKKVVHVGAAHNAVPPRIMLDAGTKAALERKILAASTGVPKLD